MPFIRKDEFEALRKAGTLMSNLCFNLSQSAAQDETTRHTMRECQQAWDKAYTATRKEPSRV